MLLQLDGLCLILNQNRETITSLEFVNCKISLAFLEAICCALDMEGTQAHKVKNFSVKASRVLEANPASLPLKLVSFLSSRYFLYLIEVIMTICSYIANGVLKLVV